jgi:C4-dicarboxylate-binding protein DctP
MKGSQCAFRVTAILLALALVTGVGTALAAEKTITLTIGTGKPIDAGKWISTIRDYFVPEISKRVAEQTDYRIKWREAYSGSVAKAGAVLEAVEMGLVDIGLIVYPFEPAKLFLHNFAYWVPFSSPNTVEVNKIGMKIHHDFEILQKVFETKYNQKWLACGAGASYQLIPTFPVQKLSDLKGRKIAAAGPNLYYVKSAGAVPVQSGIEEAYTSFKTGVYDGWLITEGIMANLKWPEVAKYITVVDLGSIVWSGITINLDTWKKLPPKVQKIIKQVAEDWSVQQPKETVEEIQRNRERIKAMGGQVSTLDPKERAAWAAALPNQPNIKAKEAERRGLPGKKVLRAYIKEEKKSGYQFPRDWKIQ